MLEGNVFYDYETDDWTLVEPDGNKRLINNLVYGLVDYFPEWENINGTGEYIKINFITV